MGEVNITIGGRSFKLGCGDGEEQHLLLLAAHLGKHVDNLRATVGKTGDEQLYLMAGLMVCDELWDSRDELIKLEQKNFLQAEALESVAPRPLKAVPIAQPETVNSELAAVVPAPAGRPAALPTPVQSLVPAPAARPKPAVKQT